MELSVLKLVLWVVGAVNHAARAAGRRSKLLLASILTSTTFILKYWCRTFTESVSRRSLHTMTSWSSSCLSFRLRPGRSLAAAEDCEEAVGPQGVLQDRGDCRARLDLPWRENVLTGTVCCCINNYSNVTISKHQGAPGP